MFGAGIAEDQLWFARSGNDLVVSVLGATDRATLQGWYASTSNQLDHFELSDGATLAATQVQQLVDAMSAFSRAAVEHERSDIGATTVCRICDCGKLALGLSALFD